MEESLRIFDRKTVAFRADCPMGDIELYYARRLENAAQTHKELWLGGGRISAEDALKDQLSALPEGLFPMVICGGSFNSSRRRAAISVS